jgi:hypothetical protein
MYIGGLLLVLVKAEISLENPCFALIANET